MYQCKGEDRWIAISVNSDNQWESLCKVIGSPDIAKDPEYATASRRSSVHDRIDQLIEAWSKGVDAQRAMEDLQAEGIPAGVVMNERDAFSDPHLDEVGFWESLEGAETGKYLYASTLWKTALTDRSHIRAAPRLGEDNEYVYKELLGFDEDKYAEFESSGHIGMDYDL